MSQHAIIRFGDGYVAIEPVFPEELLKKLRYWHRDFAPGQYGHMVATGEYRELYTINSHIDNDQHFIQRLVTMPGFMFKIKNILTNEGFTFDIIDERTPMPQPDYEAAFSKLRDYQCECTYKALMSGGGIVSCPTGWGKCLSPETLILYADGIIRPIDCVAVGDKLMGPDSKPRKVIDRIDGRGIMYRLELTDGTVIDVADHHILSLINTYDNKIFVNITVADYVRHSAKFKRTFKLYRVAVDYPEQYVNIDPYVMGANIAYNNQQYIPAIYAHNSRAVRLRLLAGIIDVGATVRNGNDFRYVTYNNDVAGQVAQLARELGFRTSITQRNGKQSLYIKGATGCIPTMTKKITCDSEPVQEYMPVGFKVRRLNVDRYVGVRLDGDMLHLSAECVVLHNTHIMGSIVRAFKRDELAMRGTPLTVIATPEKDITSKNYKDLIDMLPDREVGIVMSGKRQFSDDVQVITLNSLHLLDPNDVGVLIVDEVHTSSSSKRAESIMAMRKAAKWGVSATPTGRYDGRDIVTEGLFGPPVYERTYAQGITDGALVPIMVYWVTAPEPHIGLERYMNYKTRAGKYRNGVDRNRNQNKLTSDMLTRIPQDKQTLCIMMHIDQMNEIRSFGGDVKYVHAETNAAKLVADGYHNISAVSNAERRNIYTQMESGDLRRVLSTYVYKQGVNFPQLEVIINAGGGGSDIVARQIPGRESRNIDGKSQAILIDFWHPWDMQLDKNGKQKPGPIHSDDRAREKAYELLGFQQSWINTIDDLPLLKGQSNGQT